MVEGTRYLLLCITSRKFEIKFCFSHSLDSTAVSIFIVKLVELTNAVFVNSTNISTNIETAVQSSLEPNLQQFEIVVTIT